MLTRFPWAGLALLLANGVEAKQFRFGVGKVEITPPPGFPTGGHGPAGDVARGYWSRLHARAFYIDDSNGNGIVLVTCDFFAMPLGLRAEVWKNVKTEAAKNHVSEAGLILSATHTHHGKTKHIPTLRNRISGPKPVVPIH